MESLEETLKRLLVDALQRSDLRAEDIEDDAPLFSEEFGLDSVDALELTGALSTRFGVQIEIQDEQIREVLSSIASIATFLRERGVAA